MEWRVMPTAKNDRTYDSLLSWTPQIYVVEQNINHENDKRIRPFSAHEVQQMAATRGIEKDHINFDPQHLLILSS